MLGFGALGEFPLGGGPFGATTATDVPWFEPLSEPRRFLRVPTAAVAVNNQSFAFNPLPIVSFGWFGLLSEPVRRKKLGLPGYEQQAVTFNPQPFVSFGWFEEISKPPTLAKRGLRSSLQQFFAYAPNQTTITPFAWFAPLSDPVRIKRGLRASLQQFFTTDTSAIPIERLIAWFDWLSDPVRVKPGLRAALQQFLASPSRLLPTPAVSGVLDAIETKDTMLAGAQVWNRATDAEIGVINTTPQPAEIAVYPAATAAGVITVQISITMT